MRTLTCRQSTFVKGVLQGRSYAQAAREAGYSESVANCAWQKIASKPEVQAALKEAEAEAPSLTDTERELLENFNKLPHWPRLSIAHLITSLAAEDRQAGLVEINFLRLLYGYQTERK